MMGAFSSLISITILLNFRHMFKLFFITECLNYYHIFLFFLNKKLLSYLIYCFMLNLYNMHRLPFMSRIKFPFEKKELGKKLKSLLIQVSVVIIF